MSFTFLRVYSFSRSNEKVNQGEPSKGPKTSNDVLLSDKKLVAEPAPLLPSEPKHMPFDDSLGTLYNPYIMHNTYQSAPIANVAQPKSTRKKDPNNLIDLDEDDDQPTSTSYGFQPMVEEGHKNAYQELLDLDMNALNLGNTTAPRMSYQSYDSDPSYSLSNSMNAQNYLLAIQNMQADPLNASHTSQTYAPLNQSQDSGTSNPYSMISYDEAVPAMPTMSLNQNVVIDPFAYQKEVDQGVLSPATLLLNANDGKGIELTGYCESFGIF